MTAIQGNLCESVGYRQKKFQSYEELRATVRKWSLNRRIDKERSSRGDPMDCNTAESKEWATDSNNMVPGEEWNWQCYEPTQLSEAWNEDGAEEEGQK